MWISLRSIVIFGQIHESSEEEMLAAADIEVKRIRPRTPKLFDENKRERIITEFRKDWKNNGEIRGIQSTTQEVIDPEISTWNQQYPSTFLEQSESPVPSSFLQPPFEFYSLSINDFATEETSTLSTIQDENFSTPISNNVSTIKTLRIYEIISSNSSSFDTSANKAPIDRSFTISDSRQNKNSFDSLRSIFLNKSITESSGVNVKDEKQIDGLDDPLSNSVSRSNLIRTNLMKANPTRGNHKYGGTFDNDEVLMRKNSWGLRQRYNWRRRPFHRTTNHFRFRDPISKIGAVPGVPGQDYPVHQEHIYHQLRNNANRFPCPKKPLTHFYQADRISRCQIFYVCYGSETGVPMICPNGTLFSQHLQVCDWWFNVIC